MTTQLVAIGHTGAALQESYLRFLSRVFPSADFRTWCARGGWGPGYQPRVLVEGGEVVANVAAMRMRLVVGGRELRGVQLGAVGCLPEQRGRGLMRQLLDRVLEEMTPQADLLMLFANEEVLDFYPRFGFRPVPESTFEVSLAARPATDPAPRLDLADAHERAAWLGARAVAPSPCERFGALDYGAIALWHATNFYSHCVRSLGEQGAWVVAQQKDDLLTVLDVAAVGAFDLVAAIPRLIDAPISRVRFGFSPERFFSQARASPDTESGLFVRGEVALPESALRFPALAQT